MRSCVALVLGSLVLSAGCSEVSVTTEPTGFTEGSSEPAVTIASLSAQPVSTLSCGSSGAAADAITFYKTDRVSFTFSNPRGIDLTGAIVQRVGAQGVLGTVATCVSNPCQSVFEGGRGSAACIESGSPTATSGTVVLHTTQDFRPSERYTLQLRTRPSASAGVSSNVVDVTVVRVPDTPSNQIAVVAVEPLKFELVPNQRWVLQPGFSYYQPRILNSSGYTVEIQIALYHPDGRLFYLQRLARDYDINSVPLTLLQARASADTNVGPPWRAVVRLRQTEGISVGPVSTLSSCNSDLPSANQSACTTDQLPPPRARVVAEHMREFTLQ